MDQKNEALRLADALMEEHPFPRDIRLAAAELRRLDMENALLGSAIDKLRISHREERMELLRQRDQATAQRDALVQALKQSLGEAIYPSKMLSDVYEKACLAIKAAENT